MYEYLDESFRKEESSEYTLSIQVSLNGFSFCIRNTKDGQLLVFKHTEVKISNEQLLTRRFEDWVKEEELLQKQYKSQKLIVLGHHFTLLPSNFNDDQIFSDSIRLLFPIQTVEYSVSEIEEINVNLLFLVSPEMKRFLNDNFDSIQLKHGVENLIRHTAFGEKGKQVRLFFDEKDLYIIYFDEHQLMLCNSFGIKHANDAVYYALTALKQYNVQLKSIPVFIAGKSVFLEASKSLLEKYFLSVDYFIPPSNNQAGLDEKTISEYPCLF